MVRPAGVVFLAPGVHRALRVPDAGERGVHVEQFLLQHLVQPLDLASGCSRRRDGVMVRSGVRERLPLLELPFDECRPLGGGVAVQHSRVTWVGTQVNPGGPRMGGAGALRARRPVAADAIYALELDLTGPLELGSVRIAGTFALPEVEDAGRIDAFLRRLAPVARGQRAVGLP